MSRTFTVFALALLVAALAVPAASAGTIQVSGVQTPVANGVPCLEAFRCAMTGDLVGEWWDTTPDDVWWDAARFHASGTLQAAGTERFEGTVGDSAVGWLTFEYHAELRYAADGSLIRGRCQHKITGAGGGLLGATGVITFRDDPVTGCSDYKGHIKLDG